MKQILVSFGFLCKIYDNSDIGQCPDCVRKAVNKMEKLGLTELTLSDNITKIYLRGSN